MNPVLRQHLDWFAALSPETLAGIEAVYTDDARFSDPFHTLQGRGAIAALYARMFARLGEPRFVIRDVVASGDQAFVTWDFHYRLQGRPQQLHGGSLLVLASDGRIAEHRDYWDAAAGVYEKLPWLGSLLRWLKRRMA